MQRTMRWIVFVLGILLTLGLLLTPIWISYSFLAGSGPKVAFIPPALVLVALVFTWLWKRLVVHIAGEFEPSYFHPHWGVALPSWGSVRPGLVAAAVAVCAGAIVGQLTFNIAVSNRSTRPANQANLPISVQTETVKSQSFSAEPKAAAVSEPTPQNTPPVRIIGGSKLDPSAGTSGPAPARQPQPAPQQTPQPGSTPQSILAAKPLGPASQFQPPSATPARSGIAQQLGAQPQSNQPPSNRTRGNQAPGNQQPSATPAPYAAIANDDDRPAASRRVRHPRKQATFTSNAPRYRDENYVPRYGPDQYGAGSGGATQRFDARGYDRVYNSTANRGSGRMRAISAARG
jgi:hypothetical protein